MLAPFICRHVLGLPRTARNVARARLFLQAGLQCAFAFAVGGVCWLLLYPLIALAFAL